MKRIGNVFAGLFMLGLPINLLAHEGHGHGAGHELTHFWFSMEHIVPVAMVLALTIAILLLRYRPLKRTDKETVKQS